MFNNKSDYALNKKDTDAIVYKDADGNIIRLVRSDFSSEEEFLKWKEWSDQNYHLIENGNHVESDHTLSLNCLSEEAASVASVEDDFFDRQLEENRELMRQLLMKGLDECLTEVQHRRLWLYYVDNLTLRNISRIEGSAPKNIRKSVLDAKEKIKKYLQKQG